MDLLDLIPAKGITFNDLKINSRIEKHFLKVKLRELKSEEKIYENNGLIYTSKKTKKFSFNNFVNNILNNDCSSNFSLFIEFLLFIILSIFSFFNILRFLKYTSNYSLLEFFKEFKLSIIIPLLAYIILLFILNKNKHKTICNIIFSLTLLCLYLNNTVITLGDSQQWSNHSITKNLWMSELLANLIHHIIYILGLSNIFIAPICGFFTAFLVFTLFDEFFLNKNYEFKKILFGLLFISSGLHLNFFKGFIENTFISLPFILLFIFFILKYLKYNNKYLIYSAFFLALSCLIHGVNIFLTPSIILAIFIKRFFFKKELFFSESFFVLNIMFITAFFTFFLLTLFNFNILAGNIYGGGDNSQFVPIDSKFINNWSIYFTMFSSYHFFEVSKIIMLLCPIAFIYPLFKIKFFLKNASENSSIILLFMQILSISYLFFIFLWNFDLGFPLDYDLMTVLGVVLLIYLSDFFSSLFDKSFFTLKNIFFILIIIASNFYIWDIMLKLIKT